MDLETCKIDQLMAILLRAENWDHDSTDKQLVFSFAKRRWEEIQKHISEENIHFDPTDFKAISEISKLEKEIRAMPEYDQNAIELLKTKPLPDLRKQFSRLTDEGDDIQTKRVENIASTLRKVIADKEKELSNTSTSFHPKSQSDRSQGSENDYVQT